MIRQVELPQVQPVRKFSFQASPPPGSSFRFRDFRRQRLLAFASEPHQLECANLRDT